MVECFSWSFCIYGFRMAITHLWLNVTFMHIFILFFNCFLLIIAKFHWTQQLISLFQPSCSYFYHLETRDIKLFMNKLS